MKKCRSVFYIDAIHGNEIIFWHYLQAPLAVRARSSRCLYFIQAATVKAGVQMCVQAPFREMLVTPVKLEGGGKRGVRQLAVSRETWTASTRDLTPRQQLLNKADGPLSGRDWELDVSA